jgi:hypothetical protein
MSPLLLFDLADRRTRRAFGVDPAAWASESESEKPTGRGDAFGAACTIELEASLKLTGGRDGVA